MNIKNGFTIVELLIVIVVIAILAAISIVAYNGIQDRARSSAASSLAAQAAKKMEVAKVTNDGNYPTSLSAADIANSDNKLQYSGSATGYCITATEGNKSYKVSNTSSTPTAGGCAGHGQGGVAAVTNLAINPSFESNIAAWGPTLITATRESGGARGGFKMAVVRNGSGDAYITGSMAALKPNTPYVLSLYAWASSPVAINGTYGLQERSGSFRWIASQGTLNLTTSPQRFILSGTTPSDVGTTGGITLRSDAAVNGITVYYDAVMVTEGTTQYNYADGSTSDWVWNGAINNSTSTGPPV